MTKPILVSIDTKTLLCRRYEGKAFTLKVQAFAPILQMDIDQIRNRPESISTGPGPETDPIV